MKKLFKILTSPLSLLYGLVTFFRNKLFDCNVFSSVSFDLPIIAIGNLSMGGTGKTPHVEHLVRLLQEKYHMAVLSRGYNRKTKGYVLVNSQSKVDDTGDESLQYKSKFNSVIVAVDEKRVNGVRQLMHTYPKTQVILLDDAFQHRKINPGLNILLTTYNRPYIHDSVFPSGLLREYASGSNRADIIIVSKCPAQMHPIDKRRIKEELGVKPFQKIWFSTIQYGPLHAITSEARNTNDPEQDSSILLLTGVANPDPLVSYIEGKYKKVTHLAFGDHHNYTNSNITKIKNKFSQLQGKSCFIITTEKDSMRLLKPSIFEQIDELPIYSVPIEIKFLDTDGEEFDKQVLSYVAKHNNN